jgi:predicted nucleic acid-binding protein
MRAARRVDSHSVPSTEGRRRLIATTVGVGERHALAFAVDELAALSIDEEIARDFRQA